MKKPKYKFTIYSSAPSMWSRSRSIYKRKHVLYSEFTVTDTSSPSVIVTQRIDEIIQKIPRYIREQIPMNDLLIRFAFKTSKISTRVTSVSVWSDYDDCVEYPDDAPNGISIALNDWLSSKGLVRHPSTPREVVDFFSYFINVIPELSHCFTIQ